MSSDEENNLLSPEGNSTTAATPRKRATKKATKKAAKKATKKAAKKAVKKRAAKKTSARKVVDAVQADMFTPGEITPAQAVTPTPASSSKSAASAKAAASVPAARDDDEVTFSSDIKVDQVQEAADSNPDARTDASQKKAPKRREHGDGDVAPKSEGVQSNVSQDGRKQKSGSDSNENVPQKRKEFGNNKGKPNYSQQGGSSGQQGGPRGNNNKFKNNKRKRTKNNRWQNKKQREREDDTPIEFGELLDWELLDKRADILALADELKSESAEPLDYCRIYNMLLPELREEVAQLGIEVPHAPNRDQLINAIVSHAAEKKSAIQTTGILELLDDNEGGLLVYERDSYRVKALSAYVPQAFIRHYGLQRGHIVQAQLHPHREGESCPIVVRVESVMGQDPETLSEIVPFTERVPYYPTSRILMEADSEAKWDNLSMRVVDCLTPVGFGQRGLIVAPPRTGKTVLMQGMANSIQKNYPDAHLIILLIDERPEEVTDFRRQVKGEVISSTFDEAAESHVHAAEMVIEKARRMVEVGKDVVILLDSITRLARAYNTTMPNSGKILSGGVEANALQKPKRFFGSARNIEDGGSLTIIATALVETGSKMDEVIFEEFKGTGNMELHLDRGLSDKRIFPALSMDKSGTRKEELLYHPDEMLKIYSLRRAMKGLPSTDAMEMLIQRIKKTATNAEFLMSVAR
jgi:transcription termination factor Rho